jgi:hypothetical protein
MSSTSASWKILFAILLLGMTWSGSARAAGSRARCIAAYEDAQRLQLAQSFLLAAEKFAFCSSEECPTGMHHECATLLASVRAGTPEFVFLISDESGTALQNARIAVDEAAPQPFNGQPLSLDPGEYHFTFEADGYSPVVRTISATSAGRTMLEVRLPPACADATSVALPQRGEYRASPSPLPTPCAEQLAKRQRSNAGRPVQPSKTHQKSQLRTALLLGTSAVGVLGGAGFAYFGLSARREDDRLTTCSPGCSPQAVADVRRDYALANAALAVGLVGLVGSAVVWFTGNSEHVGQQAVSSRSWDIQLGTVSAVSIAF